MLKIRKVTDKQGLNRGWKLSKTFERFPFLMTMFSPKGSGKSTVLVNLVDQGVSKEDYVLLISSSLYSEPKLDILRKQLKRKGVEHEFHESFIVEDDEGNTRDVLKEYIDTRKGEYKELDMVKEELKASKARLKVLRNRSKTDDKTKGEDGDRGEPLTGPTPNPLRGVGPLPSEEVSEVSNAVRKRVWLELDGDSSDEEDNAYENEREIYSGLLEAKEILEKAVNRRAFLVIDDMDTSTRYKTLSNLTKIHRRFNMSIIQCGHDPIELSPGARGQIDYLILFKNINPETLKKLFKAFKFLKFSNNEFSEFYTDITSGKHDFLFYDIPNSQFRKNFDKPLNITFT